MKVIFSLLIIVLFVLTSCGEKATNKMDANLSLDSLLLKYPDSVNLLVLHGESALKDFNYEIACTEVCGRGHFSMRLLVVVEEPEVYEKWKSEQESWLSKNPEYLTKVPANLRELAMIKSEIETSTVN